MSTRLMTVGLLLVVCSLIGLVGSGAAAVTSTAGGREPVAPPATSSASADPARSPAAAEVDPDAAAALAASKGITIAEASGRLARQHALGDLGNRIEKSIAGRSGGSYLDSDGRLVVTSLDAASDAAVTKLGARAQRVDDSSARLDAIVKQLDRRALEHGAGAVQGWYVDVPTNTVVVTVTEGATDASTAAMTKLATRFAGSVRIELRPAEEQPRPASEYLVGGFQFVLPDGDHVCSVGFNTLDALDRNVVLTAGHCVTSSGWVSRNGYYIGSTRSASYPTDDFGTFWNSYPGYWLPSPSAYKYDGTYAPLAGQWDDPPVGTTVCKSGRTTGFTCGTITAVNQTINYTGGYLISGLVRHTACVEGGDSGGSNISAGYWALGVTSGSYTTSDTRCLSKSGRANISWYQPIGEALSTNGLRLVR